MGTHPLHEFPAGDYSPRLSRREKPFGFQRRVTKFAEGRARRDEIIKALTRFIVSCGKGKVPHTDCLGLTPDPKWRETGENIRKVAQSLGLSDADFARLVGSDVLRVRLVFRGYLDLLGAEQEQWMSKLESLVKVDTKVRN